MRSRVQFVHRGPESCPWVFASSVEMLRPGRDATTDLRVGPGRPAAGRIAGPSDLPGHGRGRCWGADYDRA
jgi:hypothetical protein